MKRYSELTHQELIVLTEPAIEILIDLEIAHAGILPVACPEPPSIEKEGIVASEIAYEVGSILFANEEDARKVAELPQFTSSYEYNCGGYDYKWLDPLTERTVTKKSFYRQSDIVRIKEILQRNKLKRDEYSKRKNEYDKFLSSTGKLRQEVYDVVNAARQTEEEFTQARVVMEKYRILSEGDEQVAKAFFQNTYADRPEILQEILGEH